MSWLIDNAGIFYVLLAIVAAAFFVAWRFNGRAKMLLSMLGVIIAMILLWLLQMNVRTDRQQLESTVVAMARAVEDKRLGDLFKHISKDFLYKGHTREMLYDVVQRHIKTHAVTDIRISSFRVEELSRETKFAKTSFLVGANVDRQVLVRTEADFVLEDEQWKLKTLRFFRPIGGQDQEFDMINAR